MHLLYRILYPFLAPASQRCDPLADFLDYDDTLMAAAGAQAEEVFDDITTRYAGKYILAVEGNPPLGEQGMFCISGGRPFIEKLKKAAAGASAIIARETAPPGLRPAARPNPTRQRLSIK